MVSVKSNKLNQSCLHGVAMDQAHGFPENYFTIFRMDMI